MEGRGDGEAMERGPSGPPASLCSGANAAGRLLAILAHLLARWRAEAVAKDRGGGEGCAEGQQDHALPGEAAALFAG